jgi:thiol-disulfide isomerase/thioredoxin
MQTPRPAPDLAIHVPGQPDLHLTRYKGKVVLLALLSTGCESCQHFALNQLAPLQKQYGPRGLQILAAVFNDEARANFEKFRTQFVRGFPLGYSDEKSVLAWLRQPVEEGYFTPIVAFIDRRGNIASQHLGDDMLFQDPDKSIRLRLETLLKQPA